MTWKDQDNLVKTTEKTQMVHPLERANVLVIVLSGIRNVQIRIHKNLLIKIIKIIMEEMRQLQLVVQLLQQFIQV